MTGAPLAIPSKDELDWLQFSAQRLAKTNLVPEPFRGKPDDILVVGLALRDVGINLTVQTIKQCYVIDGAPSFSAQLQAGIAHNYDIDVWHEKEECDDEHAIVHIKPPGRPERTYEYTIDEARDRGLLDEWIETRVQDGVWEDSGRPKWRRTKFVVKVDGALLPDLPEHVLKQLADGAELKRKDNWFMSRRAMLMARATTKGLKYAAPHVLLGLGGDPDVAPEVDDDRPRFDPPADPEPQAQERTQPSAPADDEPVDAELVSPDELVDTDWVQRLAIACRTWAQEHDMDPDAVRAAVVRAGTGRTTSARDVRAVEAQNVRSWFAALKAGRAHLQGRTDGSWELIAYQPGEETFQ